MLLLRVSSVPMLLQYEWNCESIPNPSFDGVSLPDNMSSREKRHTKVVPEIHIDIVGTHPDLPHNGQTVAAYLSFIAS